MQIKKLAIITLLLTQLSKAAQEPIIPKQIYIKVETTNPSIFEFRIDIPAAARLAEATENSSRNLASLPNAFGKTALLGIGAVGTLFLLYKGLKRLETDKKDLLGFGCIGGSVFGFIALCYLATTKWFTFPV